MNREWKRELERFVDFLRGIDLKKYAHLRQIKTVEQDLPKELLPLEVFYKYYWNRTDFKDFDEIFNIYWSEKLNPHIYNFIKKYFYGCSLQFVEEGFRARLYRIWVSILTQFHFQYLWNAMFEEELFSSPELDSLGIDAVLIIKDKKIGIQIKKVSYRREASSRRFTRKQRRFVDVMVEIPYLVVDEEDIERRLRSPRVKDKTKESLKSLLSVFRENFMKLDNGFVVFREAYLRHIREVIHERVDRLSAGDKLSYEEILSW